VAIAKATFLCGLAPRPPWWLPGRLWRLCRLPQHEILRCLFDVSHLCSAKCENYVEIWSKYTQDAIQDSCESRTSRNKYATFRIRHEANRPVETYSLLQHFCMGLEWLEFSYICYIHWLCTLWPTVLLLFICLSAETNPTPTASTRAPASLPSKLHLQSRSQPVATDDFNPLERQSCLVCHLTLKTWDRLNRYSKNIWTHTPISNGKRKHRKERTSLLRSSHCYKSIWGNEKKN